MNDPKQHRKLNTSSASHGASGASRSSAGSSTGRKINRSGASAASSYGPARTTYHAPSSAPSRPAASRPAARPASAGHTAHSPAPRRRKKKGSALKTVLISLCCFFGVLAVGLFGVYQWVVHSISPEGGAPTINEIINTPSEYKGDVVNVLVCGIDYEEGRAYGDGSNDGMTDMILYCQFDIKGGALRMLQIPRNTLVTTSNRTITLSSGKTYKASNYQINSVALSNGGSIAALAEVIYDQYKLPVDYYVTINMEALTEVVDNFGGIEVYIPHDMEYNGSFLAKGYRNLDGASAEFFVRNRHGQGYENADIDRLNMQRYFYAALFKRARSMGIQDILNQMPIIFNNYIQTDMDLVTLGKLAVSFMRIDSANIMIAQTPVFSGGVPFVGATDSFAGYSCVVPDAGSIAELLNTYFRTYTGPVSEEELNLGTDDWPHGSVSTSANIQFVGQLDKESDDAILQGDTDVQGAVTTDGQPAGGQNAAQ